MFFLFFLFLFFFIFFSHHSTSDGPPHILFPGTFLAGAVRLKQLRVQPECPKYQKYVPAIFLQEAGKTTGCWPSWSEGIESKTSYGPSAWKDEELEMHGSKSIQHVGVSDRLRKCFTYSDSSSVSCGEVVRREEERKRREH